MPAGVFGITDDTLNLVVNLLLVFVVVVWLALIAWTFFDARRRIDDPVLVACATAASLFPYVGTIVYSILRPPEFLDEKRERQLEIRASELRLAQLEEQSCPNCEHPIERAYLRCPQCRARIKNPCGSCGRPVDPRWSVCPYCETPLRRAAPAERPAPAERAAPAERRPVPVGERGEAKPEKRETEPREAEPRKREPAAQEKAEPARKAGARDGASAKSSGARQARSTKSKQRSSSSKQRSSSSKQRSSSSKQRSSSQQRSGRQTSSKQRS